ncbi:hypothetical protein UFOVP457_55 [uncultured Caudovirales phage]|uniref:Uncharacterized protein n=1 Tax=uncultured Caudovirales phage TaxID=2100421 RepID=A0A6J5MDF1_9CAUD|nr:hypothetical protein UFOVP457_55 [uncultured Caudovirales phage]
MPKIPEYKLLANDLRHDLTGFFSSLGLEKARIERLGKKYGYVFQLAKSLEDLPPLLTEEEENAKYYHQAEELRARVDTEKKKEMDAMYPYKPLINDNTSKPVGFQSIGELF